MATSKTILKKIMGSLTDDKAVRTQAIWSLIKDKSEEEQIELLSICFTEKGKVPSYEEELKNEGFPTEKFQELSEAYSDMIDAHLKNAFFNSRSVDAFSKQILKLINFYEHENEKIYCLLHCYYSNYIPFHELPGTPLRLSDEQFTHLLNSNEDKKDLIDYLVKLPFSSYTGAISHVLHVIDSIDSIELRTALLSYYFMSRQKLLRESYE